MKKNFTTALLSGLFALVSNVGAQVNYNLVCVDSVWYDSSSTFINVRIFNGDTTHMNYPSVQIVSPANDTIGNPSNFVNFFAHLANVYLTYTDTITQPGIPDFSSYTFLMHEGFGASTGVISWCGPVSVAELPQGELKIFPNPVGEKLYVIPSTWDMSDNIEDIEIYDALGNLVVHRQLNINSQKLTAIDVSDFTSGIYFLRAINGKNIFREKFVKL